MKYLIILAAYICVAFTADTNAEYRLKIETKEIPGMTGLPLGWAEYVIISGEWRSADPDRVKLYFQFLDSNQSLIGAGNRYAVYSGGDLDSTTLVNAAIPVLNITPENE